MEPLGRFCESCRGFSRTFGRLLENVAKIIRKVTQVHQKSTKGGPKAPKNSVPHPPGGGLLSIVQFGVFFYKQNCKNALKTGVENYVWKCPSSIPAATLFEVSGMSLKSPNLTKV